MSTTTATAGFDVLEDRLREIRRSIGLTVEESAPVAAAPIAGSGPATPRAVASTWDVVLLGAAWVGLITLIALAV